MAKLVSVNPVDGKELGFAKIATKAEVEVVVRKARVGYMTWREVSLEKRAGIMLKLAGILDKKKESLARLISQEMGKPLVEAMDEVCCDVELVRYQAETAMKVLRDEVIDTKMTAAQAKQASKLNDQDRLSFLMRKNVKVCSVIRFDPIGVVAVIKPWNFPVDSVLLSVVPALLAGNSVVLKPSESTPLVTEELAKLVWQAGVPKDVFQVVYGRGQVGAMLVDSEIDMVSFTGSTEVGREIAEKCAPRFIKCSLEMGGSSPAIILRDADLDLAVNGVLWGRFNNCGQVCNSIKRVIVENQVADEFIEKLTKAVRELRVGDPMDKKTDVGPLVSLKQLRKFQDQVTKGVVQGGRIVVGGRRMRDEKSMLGFYHEMTLMVFVRQSMDIMQEETFGPVLPVIQVENFKEAVKIANSTKYGLTAAIYTKSKLLAKQAIKELEAGSVYVNDSSVIPLEAPWGGVKESGMGVQGGRFGILEYVHKKHIHVNLSKGKTRDHWFSCSG
jgi:acyl-CoA reductase-like NAD-dependent aldehyde dehydrogenase